METLLLAAKLLGIVTTALFAAIGLINNLKDSSGRLTSWGIASIAGLVIGVAISVGTMFLEENIKQQSTMQAANEATQSTKRTERIIEDLSRSMRPLEPLRIYFHWMTLPLNDPLLKQTKERFDGELAAFQATPFRHWSEWNQRGVTAIEYTVGSGFDKSLVEVKAGERASSVKRDNGLNVVDIQLISIAAGSPVFPALKAEPLANRVCTVDGLLIIFNKVPVDVRELDAKNPRGDIVVHVQDARPLDIVREPKRPEYYLRGEFQPRSVDIVKFTDKIASILDLSAAQMLILDRRPHVAFETIHERIGLESVPAYGDYDRLRTEFRPGPLTLHFGGRTLDIAESSLATHKHPVLGLIWEYTFTTSPF